MTVFEGPDDRTVTSFEIEDGYTSIGDEAFSSCRRLRSVVIPNSVVNIGWQAFENCISLREVVIGNQVRNIESGAFRFCSSLCLINIPNSVESIGDFAFQGCSSLSEIVIPNTVTRISNFVFYSCSSLSEIVIPDSVTSIGHSAFSACTSLVEISILNSSIDIGAMYNAFSKMSGLRRVFVYPSRVDEFQEYFNEEVGADMVEVLPLPVTSMKQLQPREFIFMSNKNTKWYTFNQRNWIATFILAAYAASRMGKQKLPHLPPELIRMILEMVRRADADNKDNALETKKILWL